MDPPPQLRQLDAVRGPPIGLPDDWPILIDPAVVAAEAVVIGSGIRGSKLLVPAAALLELPGAQQL